MRDIVFTEDNINIKKRKPKKFLEFLNFKKFKNSKASEKLTILQKHPNFKSVRLAIASWMLFALSVGFIGLYAILSVKHSSAQNQFHFKTGYFYGDGKTKIIAGLGFKPEVLIIKSDTTAGYAIFKTAAMPTGEYSYFGTIANNTENQITFNDDGFTVQLNNDVNARNVIYKYVAFSGNDCTSNGIMCYGSYTGNAVTGALTQDINIGFSPDLIMVKRTTAISGTFLTSVMPTNGAGYAASLANGTDDTTANYFPAGSIYNTGFTVGQSNNTYGGLFYYLTFKKGNNILDIGSYSGNGTSKTINTTGTGSSTPDFVFVKAINTSLPIFNITQSYGNYSSVLSNAAAFVGGITELIPGGFKVGASTAANANATGHWYFSFTGSPDPITSGSFTLRTGSYIGDGNANRVINGIGFTPDLVIIKSAGTDQSIWSTSMDYNYSHYFAAASAGVANAIIDMTADGFIVGQSTTVNTNGTVYYYQAFGNATGPSTGGRASDFVIGAYTGNANTRKITNLGIKPDFVALKVDSTAGSTMWSSTDLATGTTASFAAAADNLTGTLISSLDEKGFSVGTSNITNTAGIVSNFFAFSKSAAFALGLYTGSGSQEDITTIDGNTSIGFTPDYVMVKRNTAIDGAHSQNSLNLGTSTQYFKNTANFNNGIISYPNGGFTVATDQTVNANTGIYRFMAWKASIPTAGPSIPNNITPSNNQNNINLNPTLEGSSYTDMSPQVSAMWQVSDTGDFSSPVWTRTTTSTAETNIIVNNTNGVFANLLQGKTSLQHNKIYYFKVKYSNGVYSNWSIPTSFTTNIINIPNNITPTDQKIINTLTPTLTASVFQDPELSHTALSSEWQIDSKINFESPIFDSGVIPYSNTFNVPEATLSDKTVYYWRVRYADSNNEWSSYSLPTRFLTSKAAEISIMPLFGSTIVNQGDMINIDAQIKTSNGEAINNASTSINIYGPAGNKIINQETMNYLAGTNGIYRFPFIIPNISGSYLYEVSTIKDDYTGSSAANFEVRTLISDIASAKATIEAEKSAQDIERNAQAIERSAQNTERNAQSNSRNDVSQIKTDTSNIKTVVQNTKDNLDILIGTFIVTQGIVNDNSAATSSFISSLTNSTSKFYNNAVLTFNSGDLKGQSRRIKDYDGNTKRIILDPALTSAPANGDDFTIITQNARVEEQLITHESLQEAFRNDTTSRLTNIENKIDTIINTLNNIDTNLNSIQSSINLIRDSQQKNYNIELSNVSAVQVGKDYKAKLIIQDYESNMIDASIIPSITIYDSLGAIAKSATNMTKTSTGVYEYIGNIATTSISGLWEAVVTTTVGTTTNIIRNDYFQITGSPTQVVINSISSLVVPNISANVTITNEGNSPTEYQYEWCVVSSQNNPCGGSDDIYYASAAKLINPGDSFNPVLTATVPSVGDYWFKVIVYYGVESSGASRTFTAISNNNQNPPNNNGDGNSSSGYVNSNYTNTTNLATHDNIYKEVINNRKQLDLNSQKLSSVLDTLGIISPAIQKLLSVNDSNTESIKDIQNKTATLKAVTSVTKKLIEQKSTTPIVESYMTFNSVEINWIITNPLDTKQIFKFRADLPEEATPDIVMNNGGLNVNYDTNTKTYYVSADLELGPNESISKKIEMTDIWMYDEKELKLIKDSAKEIYDSLSKTQYEAQALLLKNSIDSTLGTIILKQNESYSSPQQHIIVYRDNKVLMAQVNTNLDKMKSFILEAGASKSVVGQVGGIQTFAVWGIIIVMISGFALLMAVVFAMWKHQTKLMIAASKKPLYKNNIEVEQIKRNKEEDFHKNNLYERGGNWKTFLLWFFVIFILLLILIAFKDRLNIFSNFNLKKDNINTFKASAQEVPKDKIEAQKYTLLNKKNVKTEDNIDKDIAINKKEDIKLENNIEEDNVKNKLDIEKESIKKIKVLNTPTGWLNVRKDPDLNSKILEKIYPNQEYVYDSIKEDWYLILLKNNKGWVNKKYVKEIK